LTRFQRLAAATVAAAFLLVVIGVVVARTGLGRRLPELARCFPGQFLPGLDSDGHVWIEWLHRTVAAVIGFLILGLAALAWLDHRDRRSILWPSFTACSSSASRRGSAGGPSSSAIPASR
jgi:heme A synthase